MGKVVWKENGKVLSSWERSNLWERIRRMPDENRNGKADSKRRLAALKAWETMRERRKSERVYAIQSDPIVMEKNFRPSEI